MAATRGIKLGTGPVAKAMESKLREALTPSILKIWDESALHAGHAGMAGKDPVESHFKVIVVSDSFAGKKLLERHRAVHSALAEELKSKVHALSIVAKTPDEKLPPGALGEES